MKAIVSVLIPVYNVEDYLEKCIDSILNQTLTDIEVIAVNDGSTDKSEEILAEYAKKDNRFIYINQKNGGLPSARNTGIKNAKGKYLAFVDSDDYIEPNMLMRMVEEAENKNAEVVICGANIFPEEPRANDWLYNCLSPRAGFYEKFHPEILFSREDVSPFLWRCLIRRSLITDNRLLLDEDIILGEDKAFQTKVFPLAKGISIIEDKLYNYFWCRPSSLMTVQAKNNLDDKVLKHAKLVNRIGEYIQNYQKASDENLFLPFLDWSIPFIYNDFLSVSVKNKVLTAKELITIWDRCGYYSFQYRLPSWKIDAYNYISQFVDEVSEDISLSILVSVDFETRYLKGMLEEIRDYSNENFEIVLINNGTSLENYSDILKAMKMQNNIRLYNTPCHYSYAECLNKASFLALGEYLCYYEAYDWLTSSKTTNEWLDFAKSNHSDVCLCNFARKRIKADKGEKRIVDCREAYDMFNHDFHFALYKRQYLLEKNLFFSDCSIITGYKFWCELLSSNPSSCCFDAYPYFEREMYRQDWLSTSKCVKILKAFDELLDLSVRRKNCWIHGSVFSRINGDFLKQIVVNNTKPYYMPVWQVQNGENSQIEAVERLFSIAEKANIDMLNEYGFEEGESISELLSDVLQVRQKFLADFSDSYYK